jgi:flagellar hook-associated protein FlgK
MSIFSIGVSGLNAAQVGMLTTSHNIANASTAGYNRQQIVQGYQRPAVYREPALSARGRTSRPCSGSMTSFSTARY